MVASRPATRCPVTRPSTTPSLDTHDDPWERVVAAFLVEKGGRSGSARTVESYTRLLRSFLQGVHKTPDRVTPVDVLTFAHGLGRSGRRPSPATVGARMACVSSFYRFAMRMGLLSANPCDALQRPRSHPAPARGYTADEVARLLAVIPDTVAGRRDRAILLTLVLTARRRAEVVALRAGDITIEDGVPVYAYRGKGGVRGRRELPAPAHRAIAVTLADVGKELTTMDPGESLWQAGARASGVTSGTVAARFRIYAAAAGLRPAGLHVLRHTAAKLRRDAGESVEGVSAFLDHSTLSVTTTYLRRLEGQGDRAWAGVATAIGV